MESLFSVGDKVVCIDSRTKNPRWPCPLIEGKKYIVHALDICKCGFVALNVGIPNPDSRGYISCPCGMEIKSSTWNFNQERFIKADTYQALDEAIHQALKEDLKIKI